MLPLSGPADLAMIGAMGRWKWIHLGLLYATGMIIAGIWARWLVAPGDQRPALAVAFAVLGIGEALNGVNIAFMAGAGTEYARQFAAGTDLSAIYQAQHLAAVMSGKLGGFLVAIAAGLVAAATARSRVEPKWMVGLASLACGAGLAGNFFAPNGHPLMLTSIGLMAVWGAGAGFRIIREAGQ